MQQSGLKQLTTYQRMVKRAFDLLFGSVCLVLSFPIMLLLGILIKLDSSGPAIFKQIRVGEKGRPFQMYKLRSMTGNPTDQLGNYGHSLANIPINHKNDDDHRLTRMGRILRRTSLDELPQLLNVLKGEMSLVGPRPELPFFADQYQPWQRRRLTIPQGMTGWWQINGRDKQPMYNFTEYDLYYIDHYSFWLDLYILFKTAWVVLLGKGAF